MKESVKLGALEGFSYGWHANANDIIPIRLLKALKTAVQGLFGRFKVELSSAKVKTIINEAPNSWFAIQLNKIHDRKVTPAPAPVPNYLSQNDSSSDEFVINHQLAIDLKININEIKSFTAIDSAIDNLKRSAAICEYLQKEPGVFDGFFTQFIKKYKTDSDSCIQYRNQVRELINLGFSPSDDGCEKEVIEILEDISFKAAEAIKNLKKLDSVDNSAEMLVAFKTAVAVAREDPVKMQMVREYSIKYLNLFKSFMMILLDDQHIMNVLKLCQQMKKIDIQIPIEIKKNMEYDVITKLNYIKFQLAGKSINKNQFISYEKLISQFFITFPEQSPDFHKEMSSLIAHSESFRSEAHFQIVLISIIKNAGYSFDSDNFCMNPVNKDNPLVAFVCRLIDESEQAEGVEKVKGLLGTGLKLNSAQMRDTKKWMATLNIEERGDIKKTLEELSKPSKTFKQSGFLGGTESHERLAELQSVLLNDEVDYSDKLKHFENFAGLTEKEKLSDEDCLKYNEMLEFFVNKNYLRILYLESDVNSLKDGFKLFNKVEKHNPGILSNYEYLIEALMISTVEHSNEVTHLDVVKIMGLISLRGIVCPNLLNLFVTDVAKKTQHENPNVDDNIEFLSKVKNLDGGLISYEDSKELRNNLGLAVCSKDSEKKFDYMEKMVKLGIKLTPKKADTVARLRSELMGKCPDRNWMINNLCEIPGVNK